MANSFWVELYNFSPNNDKTFLNYYLDKNIINKQVFNNAQNYLFAKNLLFNKESQTCIEYSNKEIKRTYNKTLQLLYHKLIADCYFFMGKYIESNEYYLKAMLLADETDAFNFKGSLYFSLAVIFAIFKQYEKSYFFQDKAKKHGIEYDIVFTQLLPYLELYTNAKFKKSITYLNQIEDLFNSEKNILSSESIVLINFCISSICEDFAIYHKMIKYNNRLFSLKNKSLFLSHPNNLIIVLRNISYAHFKLKNYKKTISYCELAEKITSYPERQVIDHYLVFLKIDSLLALGKINEAFVSFKNDATKYGSTINTINSNLQLMLNSFTEKIFAKKSLFKKLDNLEKTKSILKSSEKELFEFEQKSANFMPLKAFAKDIYIEKSINKFYNKILLHLAQILEYDEFVIAIFNDKKDLVFGDLVVSNNKILDKNILPLKFYPYAPKIITENTCIIYNNASIELADKLYSFSKDIKKIESLIACPLKNNNNLLGFTLIQSETENVYNKTDIEVFKTFSYMIASKFSEFKTLMKLKTEKKLLNQITQNIVNYETAIASRKNFNSLTKKQEV